MNHPTEETWAIYADGELSRDRTREVEAHLVGCRGCRRWVVALRDEAGLLGDVLLDRPFAAARSRSSPAPARGIAIGLLPAVGAATAILAAVGWLLELRLPAPVGWLNPFNLIGAYEMFFDLLFLIRDKAPGFLELAGAVAVTASVSALLSFSVGALIRRGARAGVIGAAIACLLAVPSDVRALDVRTGEDVRIPAGETVRDTLVVSGDSVRIDGVVEGDLFAFAERIELRGEVRGNVFGIAHDLLVAGVVGGSVHVAAERADLQGRIGGSAYAGAERVILGHDAVVAGDLSALAEGLVVDGSIGRRLNAGAGWIEIRGAIAGDADTRSTRIEVFDGASIGGDFDVRVKEGESAEIGSGVHVGGETRRSALDHGLGADGEHGSFGAFLARFAIFLTAMFLVGMALHALVPGIFGAALESGGDFARALGLGLAVLVGGPVLLILCGLTVIGIPIAFIGACVYITTLFVSGIALAVLIGEAVVGRGEGDARGFGAALAVGLIAVGVASILPFVGGVLRALILLAGLGLLADRALELLRERRAGLRYA